MNRIGDHPLIGRMATTKSGERVRIVGLDLANGDTGEALCENAGGGLEWYSPLHLRFDPLPGDDEAAPQGTAADEREAIAAWLAALGSPAAAADIRAGLHRKRAKWGPK